MSAAGATPYRAHRERQRRRILDAAARLFDERGIDRVTMADITAASGLRVSTLYQYFSRKDDIVWAIVAGLIAGSAARAGSVIERAATGLEKITALLEFMAGQLSQNPAEVRFMAQFDAIYARDWPAERLLTLEAQINPEGFSAYFSSLIREGVADGSLRPGLDPELTMQAVVNAVIGAQRRLASLGARVEKEYGQPVDALFRETIRILLLGLAAPIPPPAPGKAATRSQPSPNRKRRS